MNSVIFHPSNRDLTPKYLRRLRPSSTRRERPPWRVSLDARPAASLGPALRRSRLGDMPKTVGGCAAKKVRSKSPPVVWPGVGETRARRNCGSIDHAQSALLPRPSARALAGNPRCASFKKFTHTPLPLYLAAARRAQVDGRSSSTRARSVRRDVRRDIRRVRVRARVGGAVPPSHPTPTGGFGRRSST